MFFSCQYQQLTQATEKIGVQQRLKHSSQSTSSIQSQSVSRGQKSNHNFQQFQTRSVSQAEAGRDVTALSARASISDSFSSRDVTLSTSRTYWWYLSRSRHCNAVSASMFTCRHIAIITYIKHQCNSFCRKDILAVKYQTHYIAQCMSTSIFWHCINDETNMSAVKLSVHIPYCYRCMYVCPVEWIHTILSMKYDGPSFSSQLVNQERMRLVHDLPCLRWVLWIPFSATNLFVG